MRAWAKKTGGLRGEGEGGREGALQTVLFLPASLPSVSILSDVSFSSLLYVLCIHPAVQVHFRGDSGSRGAERVGAYPLLPFHLLLYISLLPFDLCFASFGTALWGL